MNNRKKNSMSARVKRRRSSYYSNLQIASDELPDNVVAAEQSASKWVKQLIELEDKGNWVTNKLDELEITYQKEIAPYSTKKILEEGLGYQTELIVTSFLDIQFADGGDKPITIYAIPVGNEAGVVQLLMLAEKLKRTDEFVNVIILFINSDRLEYSAQHLDDWLKEQEWVKKVSGIVELAGFYGNAICVSNRHDSTLSAVWHTLMQEHQLDWSIESEEVVGSLYGSNGNLSENYESVSIGFGPSEELRDEELGELLKPKRQLRFADTEGFYKCSEMLYQSAILLSDWFKTINT